MAFQFERLDDDKVEVSTQMGCVEDWLCFAEAGLPIVLTWPSLDTGHGVYIGNERITEQQVHC